MYTWDSMDFCDKCNSECDMYEIYNGSKFDLHQGVFINEEDCGSYFVCNDNGAGLKVGSLKV